MSSRRKTLAEIAPELRLRRSEELSVEFQSARELLKANKYREALAKFKYVFSNLQDVDLSINRYQIMLSTKEMGKLAKNYAPALVSLKRWRNQKEKLILQGVADSELISSWDQLNSCLKESERTFKVFDKLKQAPVQDEEILDSILWHIWEKLARAKRYEDLRGFLRTLGWRFFLNVAEYETQLWFPSKKKAIRRSASLEYLLLDGGRTFEVALGLKHERAATAIQEKLLSVSKSDKAFAVLIRAAIRARDVAIAKSLFGEAKLHLTARQMRECNRAMKPVMERKPRKTRRST